MPHTDVTILSHSIATPWWHSTASTCGHQCVRSLKFPLHKSLLLCLRVAL